MAKPMDVLLNELEGVLRTLLEQHDQMLAILARKRQALTQADHRTVAACAVEENQRVQSVGELEKRRLALTAELTLLLEPAAAAPLRLPELAPRLPEPARGRLLVLRLQLRQRIEEVQREAGVVRRATEALTRHMQGLIQSISSAVAGVGLYTRAGAAPKAALAVSTFNVKG